MSTWASLVRTAVLGTERGVLTQPTGDTPLETLLAAAVSPSAEQTLLRQAGLIAQYESMGQLPPQTDSPPATESFATTSTQQMPFMTMFANRYKDMLPAYLARLVAANQTVSPRFLPNVLDYGAISSHQSHLVIDAIGPHGRQIAEHNPQWAYATKAVDTWDGANRLWRKPKIQRRQALLRQLRHRKPDLGRPLLSSTWKSESDTTRLGLLRLLETNLSSADEPFIEAARSDRHAAVRREAVRLLCMLPNSNLSKRMTLATVNVIRWNSRNQAIEVRFPAVFTSSLTRDGVPIRTEKKKGATLRMEQLGAMVRAVPLDVWPQRLGISAEKFLAAVQTSSWPRTLTSALIQAVQNQNDSAWAIRILTQQGITPGNHKLVAVLTPETRDRLARRYAEREHGTFAERGSQFLRLSANLPVPWSITCSELWLNAFVNFLSAKPDRSVTHAASSSLRRFSRACPPVLLDTAINALLPLVSTQSWRGKVQEAIHALRFRKEMEQSISG